MKNHFSMEEEKNAHVHNYCERANIPVLTSVCNYNKSDERKERAFLYLYKYEKVEFDLECP